MTSVPPSPPHKVDLTRTATRLREALLHDRLHRRTALSAPLNTFPLGAGRAASTLLAWTLRAQGRPAELLMVHAMEPDTGQGFTHTWVFTPPFHLDITGDQFTLSPAVTRHRARPSGVYVERAAPPWARGRPGSPAGSDPDLDTLLQADFDRLQAWLQAIPPVPQQARRRVVDAWQGTDVLECGHVRHNPNRGGHQARVRPCMACPAQPTSRTCRLTGDSAALDWFARLSDEARGALVAELHARHAPE